MSQQLNDPCHFIIQSEYDNQQYTVDKKIIDSSTLLKNICDITKITEPIIVKCSGEALEVFIQLINNYQEITNDHDIKFEKTLYDSFLSSDAAGDDDDKDRKQKLIKLIQNLCILDSDFFLDSISDYILEIVANEESVMDWNEIQEYFGFEDDFSEYERNLIENDENQEYFLSIDTDNFKFPFVTKNLYFLKTHFSTPMNVLIARIIQRSNEKISYLLSIINKTIKNEVDRHPLKVDKYHCSEDEWRLNFEIVFKQKRRYFNFCLEYKSYDENIFNVLKDRKIIANGDVTAKFEGKKTNKESGVHINSLNFIISKSAKIYFDVSYKTMYHFDVTKCPIPKLFYHFVNIPERGTKFEEVYNHLIANAFSKAIKIMTHNFINICSNGNSLMSFLKNPNSSKFRLVRLLYHRHLCQDFIEIVTKYMEDDGLFQCRNQIQGIPLDTLDTNEILESNGYPVSVIKKYLEFVIIK